MTDPAFLRRVQALTGASRVVDAERTAQVVLRTLLDEVPKAERAAVRAALPPSIARLAGAASDDPAAGVERFYARVAERAGSSLGGALEDVQCVCRALGEWLDGGQRQVLVSRLPDQLGALLAPPEPLSSPLRGPAPPEHARATLAQGKPGSGHPLHGATAPHGHAHSVAETAAPHEDTQLSTSPGTTQERLDDTLARGKPRRRRSISEG